MDYVSFSFYIFLAATIVAYYLLPLKYRYIGLFLASVGFYVQLVNRSVPALLLLGLAAATGYISAVAFDKLNNDKTKKTVFIVALVLIIAPLFIIKEAGILQFVGLKNPASLVVPVGISFYTLQILSYVIDVYKGEVKSEKDIIKYILFVTFFPIIIQGPISRFSQLSPQLSEGHRFDEKKFQKGFLLILWGFFLKLVIADKAGVIVDTVFNDFPRWQGAYVIVAGVLYSLQLYADFLACTTLAQGVAKLFSIDIISNFNHPYFSKSVNEFWRRWHISLSSWLRDYIYIPLGGNRKGTVRKWINLFVVFFVSGMWHGSGMKFIFWGMLHGVYQFIGFIIRSLIKRVGSKLTCIKKIDFEGSKLLALSQIIVTFILVTVAWVVFRADSLGQALSMLKTAVTVYNPWVILGDGIYSLGLEMKEVWLLFFAIIFWLFVEYQQEKGLMIHDEIIRLSLPLRWMICIGAIIFIMIFGTYGYGFDAQSFIYGGF